jgi:AcrR family transcriptional regulator
LSASQIERRARLLESARELASEGGYAAVTMRDVAERAGVGLATVYRYFASKDHLIAEVNGERSRQLIAALQRDPPKGETAAERVAGVFDRMFEVTVEDLKIAAAGVVAMTSADPAASSPEYWNSAVIGPYLDAALGDADLGDRLVLGQILGHLFFSLMIGLTSGRMQIDGAKALMREAIGRVVREEPGT